MVSSLWIVAVAVGGAPKVTATIKTPSPTSRLVHIVNRDHVTYRDFIVETTNKPQLIAVAKPCAIERDGNFNGTTFNWRYQAKCSKAVAPGKTFDIRLSTKGSGRIVVYVVVKGMLSRINE